MIHYINKSENKRLILIFTGWSTDFNLYNGLNISGWDIAVVYDYQQINLDLSFLNEYSTIYLFAWSLGVAVADAILPKNKITAAFAINGTFNPVSDKFGIPVDIFLGTANNLSQRNLSKFQLRMMPDKDSYLKYFGNYEMTDKKIEILKRELLGIADYFNNDSCNIDSPNIEWKRAYLGKNDRIFPFENMLSAWKTVNNIDLCITDDAHYMDIPNIIKNNIPDLTTVSERFSKAMGSYDSYAISQQLIASHLASYIKYFSPKNIDTLIEIGPGTGIMSRLLSSSLHPENTYFVDIVNSGPFPWGKYQHYIQADAEQWISSFNKKADMIISASCIQWFADIPVFIKNCSKILRKSGILALSTFLPGNFHELDQIRPTPLRYPSKDVLKNVLSPDFDIVVLNSQQIKMEFNNRRNLLMHLKHTGVAGNKSADNKSIFSLKEISSLTYLPVYLIAVKK